MSVGMRGSIIIVCSQFIPILEFFRQTEDKGPIDDYKVVSGGDSIHEEGSRIVLVPIDGGMPIGGSWGKEYDIVEEVFDEKTILIAHNICFKDRIKELEADNNTLRDEILRMSNKIAEMEESKASKNR